MKIRTYFTMFSLFLAAGVTFAQEPAESEEVSAKFAVIIPEQIDRDWYWVMYSDVTQHIVQGAVEKALIRAGIDVIDLSAAALPAFNGNWSSITSRDFAAQIGELLEVDYIISGYATAVKASESKSYGINTVRTQVDITAKIIRVSDGQVVELFDESLLSGGQSVQAAAKSALREAGDDIGRTIGRWAQKLLEETSEP